MWLLRIAVRELCKFYEMISSREMFFSAEKVTALQASVQKCLVAYQWLSCNEWVPTILTEHNQQLPIWSPETNVMLVPSRLCAIEIVSSLYERLAEEANDRGKLIWSLVNKHHFFYHVGRQAEFGNPSTTWTYMPEDYVGRVSKAGHGAAVGSGICSVIRKIAERIRVVRHLQLVRGFVDV